MKSIRTLTGLLLALFCTSVAAQGVVRLVVPFGAGAVQDTIARSINAELGQALGRSVIVENRSGAGGTIGTGSVAKSPPDGTTLILAGASHTIAGSLYAKLPYHPLNDFTPVANIGIADYAFIVNAAVPAKTIAEFIAHAKANPGKLNYASAGNGSATHLSMAYFAGLAGIDMVHVPLKSTGEAVNEVLAGRAQAVIAATIGAIPFAKDARVRLLGMTGAQRSKYLPELPTVAESGLPGYEFDSWIGVLGPAGIPKATVDQLGAAMAVVMKDPAVLDRLNKQGVEPKFLGPEGFGALLRDNFAKMARVVKASGARID
jgi:tripartite-type tricarboxylate transporter receptor subunit TctC